MKKYIVRAVCLAAVFLLACVPASASVQLLLKEYGLQFEVPEGYTWIYTDDAGILSSTAKKDLEAESAIGGLFSRGFQNLPNSAYCAVLVFQDELFGVIDYNKISDERFITLFTNEMVKQGLEDVEVSLYYAQNGKRWVYIDMPWKLTSYVPFNAHVAFFGDTAVAFLAYYVTKYQVESILDTVSYTAPEITTNAYFPNAVVTSDSSYFSRIGYDVKGKILYVTMREDGKDYAYKGVSAVTWGLLKVGGSVDKYFDIYVRLQHEAMPLQ
mgnify:CR=1 FL=1